MSKNYLLIEKKAHQFRNHTLGMGDIDPLRLKSVLSKLNVLTVYKPLANGFCGMAIKIENKKEVNRFILVNSNHPLGKQHFTICHELYHLFIQENFNSMICNTGMFPAKGGEELNADLFAAYLLMPKDGIMEMIPDHEMQKNKISLQTILKIEHFYSCSRAALLYRLKDLKIIDSTGYDAFKDHVKKGAILNGYETGLYEDGNHNLVIGDYGALASRMYENEKISKSHYYSLLFDLNMNVEEIAQLENGEE